MRSLLLIIFTSVGTCFAQVQSARFEREKTASDPEFHVFSGDEKGLILFREMDEFQSGKQLWEFQVLDDSLNTSLEFSHYIDSDFNLAGYSRDNDHFYMLYRDGTIPSSDLHLYKFNFSSSEAEIFQIKNEIELDLSHFLVVGDHLVLGGRVINKPAVLHYSMQTNQVDVLPGFYKKETVLVDMQKNVNGTFNVLLLDRENNLSKNVLRLKVYSYSGEELMESTTAFEDDIRIHSGTTNHLKGDDLVIVGTYGTKKSKLSSGYYFVKVRPGVNDRATFIDFTQLRELFMYLGDNREERILEKIENSSSRDPYEHRATVIVWKLVETPDRYAIFSELVDPEYQNINQRNISPYANMGSPFYDERRYTSSYDQYYSSTNSLVNKEIMTSVKYRECIMLVLDRDGRMIGEAAKIIENMETPILDQITAVHYMDGNYHMLYKRRDELFMTFGQIQGNHKQDSVVNISSLDPLDEVRNDLELTGRVEHWYGNHYFVWGYQRIQNIGLNENRYVFYINKITM